MNRATELVHGCISFGGLHKRIVMLALATHANAGGVGRITDRKLRNETEIGRKLLAETLEELKSDGWLRRQNTGFILAIERMKASQRPYILREADPTVFQDYLVGTPSASSSPVGWMGDAGA